MLIRKIKILGRLLGEPEFKAAAARIQASLQACGGTEKAADYAEALLAEADNLAMDEKH